MSGLGTLFKAEAGRLLRTQWGDKIYEFQGMDEKSGKPKFLLRNPGVQELAEEIYSLLNSERPITTAEPITFFNTGTGPAINIVNLNQESPAISITSPSGSSITIGSDGLVINKRDEADIQIDRSTMNNLANRLDQPTVDLLGNVLLDRDGCNRIVRPFLIDSYIAEGGYGEAPMARYDIDSNSWLLTGRRFQVMTYFFTGALLPGDLALAQWDCDAQVFHLTGSGHTYIRGILVGQLHPFSNTTMELDDGSVVAIHEAFGITSSLLGGTMVAAAWNKQLKRWEKTP